MTEPKKRGLNNVEHRWDNRARCLMRLVAGGAIEDKQLSQAVREAEYNKGYVKNPRRSILYPLLKKYAVFALPYLVSKGMSPVAALKLWAKAMGQKWQNALMVAGLEELGIKEELYAAGVTEQAVAQKIADLMDAEFKKAYKKGGEVKVVSVPDNPTQSRATALAAKLLDVMPTPKLKITGKVAHEHAHLHGVVPINLTELAKMIDTYDPDKVLTIPAEVVPE